jgi:hypothetical protein
MWYIGSEASSDPRAGSNIGFGGFEPRMHW